MSRTSTNQINADGILINGFDYENQAWVIGGVYMPCGHPEPGETINDPFTGGIEVWDGCNCYGRIHAGEPCTTRGSGNFHHHDCDNQDIDYYGPLCSTLCGLAKAAA